MCANACLTSKLKLHIVLNLLTRPERDTAGHAPMTSPYAHISSESEFQHWLQFCALESGRDLADYLHHGITYDWWKSWNPDARPSDKRAWEAKLRRFRIWRSGFYVVPSGKAVRGLS